MQIFICKIVLLKLSEILRHCEPRDCFERAYPTETVVSGSKTWINRQIDSLLYLCDSFITDKAFCSNSVHIIANPLDKLCAKKRYIYLYMLASRLFYWFDRKQWNRGSLHTKWICFKIQSKLCRYKYCLIMQLEAYDHVLVLYSMTWLSALEFCGSFWLWTWMFMVFMGFLESSRTLWINLVEQ